MLILILSPFNTP